MMENKHVCLCYVDSDPEVWKTMIQGSPFETEGLGPRRSVTEDATSWMQYANKMLNSCHVTHKNNYTWKIITAQHEIFRKLIEIVMATVTSKNWEYSVFQIYRRWTSVCY